MILRERHRPIPTVHVPPWTIPVDPTTETYSPRPVSGVTVNSSDIARGGEHFSPRYLHEALTAFQSYLPSNEQDPSSFPVSGVTINSNGIADGGEHCSSRYLHQALTAFKRYLPSSESDPDPDLDFFSGPDSDAPIDAYSCDQFRMYEFKVRRCARGRSHDWTDCPYVHPGEKARRRDPRKYHYSGTACPEFRKGSCKKGELCEFAHGVFECWLHPARYRTLPCKDGTSCQRRVCFFAHTPEQLRVLPSQSSQNVSPPLSPVDSSPPLSPMNKSPIHEIVASLRRLHLGKVNKSQPGSWTAHVGSPNNIVWSPRGSVLRPELFCLPTTPNGAPSRAGIGYLNLWEQECDEPAMERVESGRGLRVKMFERLLSNENCLERGDPDPSSSRPDLRWVSELVK